MIWMLARKTIVDAATTKRAKCLFVIVNILSLLMQTDEGSSNLAPGPVSFTGPLMRCSTPFDGSIVKDPAGLLILSHYDSSGQKGMG
jgi:hypothetical protein